MNEYDIEKQYVSPIDIFFAEFDAAHACSQSQNLERKKHQRIAALRDNPDLVESKSNLWEKF